MPVFNIIFRNNTIAPLLLAALVGAHIIGGQRYADLDAPETAHQSLDSMPGVWDGSLHREKFNGSAPPRVYDLPSDVELAKHELTESEFRRFAAKNRKLLPY